MHIMALLVQLVLCMSRIFGNDLMCCRDYIFTKIVCVNREISKDYPRKFCY